MASASVQVFLLSLSCVLFFPCNGQGSSGIRLVGGSNQYEGRVEVNRSGEWQTVCDDFWDIREAEVVCRQLGYGYAILAIQGAAFGQGSGGQWERAWFCNGNESSLDDCNSSNTSCTHYEDASVICSGNALSNDALRLVDTGSTQFGGRLEVYQNNEWGTVCVDLWGFSDATVACRQMGFVGVNDSESLLFGSGASSQRIWLDNVACRGSESRLIDCSHDSNTADCSHSEDVGIVCSNGSSSNLRLVGGSNQYEGRVEIYRSGEWQTVCDNFWDIREAEVVCRQLGYEYAILAIQEAAFGQGSGGQWERAWFCNGNESILDDCSSSSAFCSHSEDASVICSSNALNNGALRLVDTGSTRFGGRLEVYYNSVWGTVCDDAWGSSDATVACRQMGFVSVSDSDSSLFGSGASSQRIWLDDVACRGSESRLIDCSHDGIGNTADCSHSEDVGIVCIHASSDIRLVGGSNQYEGRVEVYRSGEWQTVCDNFWDIREAEVVCQQLGYGYAILAIQGAAFGQGSGGQWERAWFCNGSEDSLSNCSSSSAVCTHSEDASVICSGSVHARTPPLVYAALSNGALRLVNTGSIQFGGRLEIYFSISSEWGTVCDDSWGLFDAIVACQQMGFVGVSDSDSSLFGSGASSQNIWLDDVACRGSESRLIDCNYDDNTADCSHSEDIGIVCTNVRITNDDNEDDSADGSTVGGGVSGGVIIFIVVCIFFCCCYGCGKKKKNRKKHHHVTNVIQMTPVRPPTVVIVNQRTDVQHNYPTYPQVPGRGLPPAYNPRGTFHGGYPPQKPYS